MNPVGASDESARVAAREWLPRRLRLLLVPFAGPEGAFYVPGMSEASDRLRERVAEVLFDTQTSPEPAAIFAQLRRRGVWVMPLVVDGETPRRPLADYVTALALRVPGLEPEAVVLVGERTTRAAHRALAGARMHVEDAAAPDAAAASAAPMRHALRAAVVRAGLERLIRPLARPRPAPRAAPGAAPASGPAAPRPARRAGAAAARRARDSASG